MWRNARGIGNLHSTDRCVYLLGFTPRLIGAARAGSARATHAARHHDP